MVVLEDQGVVAARRPFARRTLDHGEFPDFTPRPSARAASAARSAASGLQASAGGVLLHRPVPAQQATVAEDGHRHRIGLIRLLEGEPVVDQRLAGADQLLGALAAEGGLDVGQGAIVDAQAARRLVAGEIEALLGEHRLAAGRRLARDANRSQSASGHKRPTLAKNSAPDSSATTVRMTSARRMPQACPGNAGAQCGCVTTSAPRLGSRLGAQLLHQDRRQALGEFNRVQAAFRVRPSPGHSKPLSSG